MRRLSDRRACGGLATKGPACPLAAIHVSGHIYPLTASTRKHTEGDILHIHMHHIGLAAGSLGVPPADLIDALLRALADSEGVDSEGLTDG